jgi:small GTP-binding protein
LDHVPTVFDNYSAFVNRSGIDVTFELLDTAGQEDYDRLRPLSYAGVDVVMVCFATTSRTSFERVQSKWLPEIRHFCPGTPVVLVGLKTDLRDEILAVDAGTTQEEKDACVAKEEGAALCKAASAVCYREVSARTRVGLTDAFNAALDDVLQRRMPARVAAAQAAGSPATGFSSPRRRRWKCSLM